MSPGEILFHRQFKFHDGAAADKYLVVLASDKGTLIVAKTTSKGHHHRNDHGCQAGSHFPAFLLTQGCCCLRLNTWICLDEFYEFTLNEFQAKIVGGVVNRYGCLTPELTLDVQVCAAGSDDISQAQEISIRAHLAA